MSGIDRAGVAMTFWSAVVWSTGGFFVRLIPLDLWTMLGWRSVFGLLSILVFAVWQKGPRGLEFAKLLSWPGLLLVLCSGVGMICFVASTKLTSVANVTIIGAVQPALVLLLAGRLFGERVTARGFLWAIVALVGTAIVMVGSAGMQGWSPLGDALAVANLLAFTAYFLASKQIRTTVATFEYVVGMTTVAGVVILIFCLMSGQDLGAPVGRDWLIFVFLAVVPGTLGHFLTNWAHEHTPAFVMSIMLLAVPVLASGAAALFLGESLRQAHVIGGTIVLVAIGIVVRSMHDETGAELAEGAARTDAP